MTRSLLLWILTWAQPMALCDGSQMFYPEQVTYSVKYVLRGMVTSPACPVDETGQMQACATVVGFGEFPTGSVTRLSSDSIPVPLPGQVYDVQEPVACNLDYGRLRCSDECQP